MSSPLVNPRHKPPAVDWARLIPGGTPAFRTDEKKPVRSVRLFAPEKVSGISAEAVPSLIENLLAFLVPGPLQTRIARSWLRCTSVDFALVGLNWLLIGALLVPLRRMFPQVRVFGFAAGVPISLLGIALLHATLITLHGHSEGLYAGGSDFARQARILGKSVLWATAILSLSYGLQASWPTSGLICGAGILHVGALLAWRWQSARPYSCAGHRVGNRADDRDDVRNVLIVGAGSVGRRVAAHVEAGRESGRNVCGFLDNEKPLGDGVIGRVSDLPRLARIAFVDEVILAAPRDRDLTLEVLREARLLRLDVKIVPDLFGCKPMDFEAERVGDMPMICLHAERLPVASLILKRLVDVAGAGIALLALLPSLLMIAALIKLSSRGPVLYRGQRAGRKGRLFRCYKFRTMVRNADQLKNGLRENNQRLGPFFKIADDPRITRLGRYLRRYSLDELPQLWNVLRGDMSLVGPRPHPLDDVAAYQIEHLARLDVTPGITGLWQVMARRDPSFQRGMDLDREYIRTWSLQSDMRILAQTFLAVMRGSGD